MTDINKQRFLAELGKLLTFMYEEDRQAALAMYSEMFDSGVDEQTLLHQLVSPTRQAVVIARAYNQRERTLQTSARSRGESYYEEPSDDVPGYIVAIEDIRRQLLGARETARIQKEQLSLFEEVPFDEDEDESGDENGYESPYTGEATPAAAPLFVSVEEQAAAEPVSETDEPSVSEERTESPSEDEVDRIIHSVTEEHIIEERSIVRETAGELPAAEDGEESASDAEDEGVTGNEAETEELQEEAVEPVSESQSGFIFEDKPQRREVTFQAKEQPRGRRDRREHSESRHHTEQVERTVQTEHKERREHAEAQHEGRSRVSYRREDYSRVEMRARPLLLVLYVLVAVPVGLLGGLILLLPILLFLALTVLAIWLGIAAVSAAFGGFAMFSDLMVVLGAGLVLLALGLLFLWLFIWFIGGVLAGFINGLIALGGRLCYKEVEVE